MQGTFKACRLIPLICALAACSFQRRESFEAAVGKYRNTAVDQVNPVGDGLPFFTPKTLNPIWQESAETVRFPPISLIDQNGKTRTERLFDGKISIVVFMFTSCTGFCPVLVRHLRSVETKIGSRVDVQYVAITVDPKMDDASHLRAFAKKLDLDRSWTLLTGSEKQIYALVRDTFATQAFQRKTSGLRDFAHSEHFYILDQERRLRAIIDGTRLDSAAHTQAAIAQLAKTRSVVSN